MVFSEIIKDSNSEMESKISKDGLKIKDKIKLDQLIVGLEGDTLKNFKCQICNKVNFDFDDFKFLQCRNGDYCCNDCWILSIEEIKECKICKSSIISMDQLSRNKFMENEFKKTSFKCPYSLENSFIEIVSNGGHYQVEKSDGNGYIVKLCNEIVKFEYFNQHIIECNYQIINCDHCKCKLQRIDYQKHLDQDCESLMGECHYCYKNIQCIKLSYHLNNECDKYYEECSNKCGQLIKISNLQNHLSNECPDSSIECPIVGCTNSPLKRFMLSNHIIEHLNKQITFTNDIMNKYLDLENKISQLTFQKMKEPLVEYSNYMFIDSTDFGFGINYYYSFRIHGIKFYFRFNISKEHICLVDLHSKKLHKNFKFIDLVYELQLNADTPHSFYNQYLTYYKSVNMYNYQELKYTSTKFNLDELSTFGKRWLSPEKDKKIKMHLKIKFIRVEYAYDKNRFETTIPKQPQYNEPFKLRTQEKVPKVKKNSLNI